MKKRILLPLLALTFLLPIACEDTADNLGKEIRPTDDEIIVATDTFHLSTETLITERIISRPDSFLLGEYENETFGIARGDILAELKLFKEGFTYLDASEAVTVVDSTVMTLGFVSYFGNANSPMHISVYELKDSLRRKTDYMSDIDPTSFVDYTKLIGDTTFSILDGSTVDTLTTLRFHMKDEFKNRFFTTDAKDYATQDDFRNFFNGIYITTDLGGASMINVQGVRISLYYHYYYKRTPSQIFYGRHDFYITNEVKRVNRIIYPYRIITPSQLDTVNHIISPANYYTKVRIPINNIRNRVKVPGKALAINSASINVNILKNSEKAIGLPRLINVLLVKESSVNRFFAKRELPSDTCAFLASIDSTYISTDNYKYKYTFNNLSTLIENEIKKGDAAAPYLDMVLVPVTPVYTTSSSSSYYYSTAASVLSEVIQSNQMAAISVYSGRHPRVPMKMEIVYSGF